MSSLTAVITEFGAEANGAAVQTAAIQAAIDHVAVAGGGTVVIPAGVFVSGALFLKPGVNLHLAAGAVLRCATDMAHFPRRRTRIEGHFEDHFTPALINANGCDDLTIDGAGTLDGAGRPIWDLFWRLRGAAPDPAAFPNLSVDRARLALIEASRRVTVTGITFKDSQFWNLHLYRCAEVTVRDCRFEVPDDYAQAPSTDGIDLDSCQDVTIDGCFFSLTDDCIAAKGSKGPYALADRDSPPVERVRVRKCHFRRGHQAFTCGSEATIVRDVIVEDCHVSGAINVLMLKLRPDTPQHYETIHVRRLTLDSDGGRLVLIEPWAQFKEACGEAPPRSTVRDIVLSEIKGRFGAFGIVRPNPGQTEIRDIALSDIVLDLTREADLQASGVENLRFEDVVINGQPVNAANARPLPELDGGFRVSG